MTRALGKVQPKAVRVTKYGVITGIKDAVSDKIQEVTNFLIIAPRSNSLDFLESTTASNSWKNRNILEG